MVVLDDAGDDNDDDDDDDNERLIRQLGAAQLSLRSICSFPILLGTGEI